MRWIAWLSCLLITAGLHAAPADTAPAKLASPPGQSDAGSCAACHPAQATLWERSHHAQSMQPATQQTVLGNFGGATLRVKGESTVFFRRGARFMARTTGGDGRPQDVEIAYTFGVSPLQEYLVAAPGGRLQVLGAAWDARPAEAGGQRWYSLNPESPPRPGEPLHWSGRDQNWNFMCADCHSSGVRRNYDAKSNRFSTSWSSIDVACEACHGPGAAHVAWAQGPRTDRPQGLYLAKGAVAVRGWRFSFADDHQRIVTPQSDLVPGRDSNETCAPCHSRRMALVADPGVAVGTPYLDRYQPLLIEPGVYKADGQIDGEVFEYTSFAQSAMHGAGVACVDCHEPHGLALRAPGNALCSQCHRGTAYDRPEHHHHAAGSPAAQCVSCHMPTRTYMGVHVRHDHSLRVPEPAANGPAQVPDPCTACHVGRPATWSAAAIAGWRAAGGAPPASGPGGFAGALDAAWNGHPDEGRLLSALAQARSGVAKASVLSVLPPSGSGRWLAALTAAAQSDDEWVRLGAARALAGAASPQGVALGARLLDDPRRAIRIEAARSLVGTPDGLLSTAQRQRLQEGIKELVDSEQASADRPESHVNRALIRQGLGQATAAEQELRTALRLDPQFEPALVNLADLYRNEQRDAEGEALLRRAVRLPHAGAESAHALGLLLVRRGQRAEALLWLRKAVALAPGDVRYAQVLKIAERELGAPR